MKITFKRTNGEYTVTVNGHPHTFNSGYDAWNFIFNLRKVA